MKDPAARPAGTCSSAPWQSAASLYPMVRYISSREATGTSPLVRVPCTDADSTISSDARTGSKTQPARDALSMALDFCDPLRPY
eukprot:scaffold1759_cov18-Prasinocladus_malaysianus.AAC.1